MDQLLIAAISGATGALVGVLVRPCVEDRLRQRSESTKRQRQAINERLDRGHRELRFAETVGTLLASGFSPTHALDQTIDVVGSVFEANQAAHFRAESIDEPGLREQVSQYDAEVNRLLWAAFRATRDRGELERAELLDRLPYEALEIRALEGRIIERMECILGARGSPVREIAV